MGLVSNGLPTSALDYDLPPGSIATHPARPRSSARLLVADQLRQAGIRIAMPESIPHDLWAAGELPPMPLAHRLAILLAGFNQAFPLAVETLLNFMQPGPFEEEIKIGTVIGNRFQIKRGPCMKSRRICQQFLHSLGINWLWKPDSGIPFGFRHARIINGSEAPAEAEFYEALDQGADINLVAEALGNALLFQNKYYGINARRDKLA